MGHSQITRSILTNPCTNQKAPCEVEIKVVKHAVLFSNKIISKVYVTQNNNLVRIRVCSWFENSFVDDNLYCWIRL